MSRVLVVTTAEKGHLNPMVGPVQWLRKMGHDVGWLCIPDPAPELARLDVKVVEPPTPLPRPPHVTGGRELAELVRDRERLRAWIQRLLIDAVPEQIEPIRAALQHFAPDVIALDPMLYQAVIASHLEEIPWVSVSSSLNPITPDILSSDLLANVASLAEARRELFARHGMDPEFRVCDCLSPFLTIAFTTELYAADLPVPARTRLVGPSIPPGPRGDEPDFAWERIPSDRPLIYASFGSQIYYQPDGFRRLAEAAATLNVHLVLSCGDLAEGELSDLGDNVLAAPYVPQLQLLDRAQVFVTHGGANSVMEALRAGVPMVISPVCNDQFHQAWFLERAGAGVQLDLLRASTEACRATLAHLLQVDAPERTATHAVSRSYRAQDGAREAARLISELR